MRIRTRLLALASAAALFPAFLGPSAQTSWALPARNEAPQLPIGTVQGSGDSSPYAGRTVIVEGVVTGDFQGEDQFHGVFIQDAGDGDDATSDGIFVHDKAANDLSVGERVQVKGKVGEHKGQTQITSASVTKLDGGDAVAPLNLELPVADWERYEGMLLKFPQSLTILDSHNFDRYGELIYGTQRQWTPTGVTDPGQSANDLLTSNNADRLTVDDGRSSQNPTPAMHPNGKPMAKDNYFRTGDQVANLTGVLGYNFGSYRLQPIAGADYTASNPRPETPQKQGNLRVASFNVLNYFTTLTSDDSRARGADTPEEFQRQQAKIVAAMTALDADVFGLMEIENNGRAVDDLVAALNTKAGEGTYAAVTTGKVGGDAIFQAFVYKPATVEPAGSFATLSFGNTGNRPSLLQTFRHKESGELLNVSVNHLKSKGSACKGDPDQGDGQGNCNQTRTQAAEKLVSWLQGDPTGQGAARTVIIGDLNSYDHEDPVKTLVDGGYADMEKKFAGEQAYSYVFDGMSGYLDHALANQAAESSIVDAQAWHINADEADIFDYGMTYKKAAEQELYSPDPYRSSDHDPVVVSLQLGNAPTSTAQASSPAESAASNSAGSALSRPGVRPGLPKTSG
jgi:endonuclease/exonuclease/phosphatase